MDENCDGIEFLFWVVVGLLELISWGVFIFGFIVFEVVVVDVFVLVVVGECDIVVDFVVDV